MGEWEAIKKRRNSFCSHLRCCRYIWGELNCSKSSLGDFESREEWIPLCGKGWVPAESRVGCQAECFGFRFHPKLRCSHMESLGSFFKVMCYTSSCVCAFMP